LGIIGVDLHNVVAIGRIREAVIAGRCRARRSRAQAIVTTDLPDAERLRGSGALHVIAPRLWDLLPEDVRADARVVLIRHVFAEADARALGTEIERYAALRVGA
jgi:hypothetical protein